MTDEHQAGGAGSEKLGEAEETKDREGHEKKVFHIKIDRTDYKVHQPTLTGSQLRSLATPPIGVDRDLFEVVPGGSDRKIADTEVVNPGRD